MTDHAGDNAPVGDAEAAIAGRPAIAVPTSGWQPGDPALLRLLIGVLRGDWVGAGEFCCWVELESGEIVPVVWPSGFSARLDPFELLNPAGDVAATLGDKLSLCGGLVSVTTTQPCSLGLEDAFHVMQELP
jgi:hypothetical protein